MKASDEVFKTWKRPAARFFRRLYTFLPSFPAILAVHRRAISVVEVFEFIARSGIQGDYIEFGVFQGDLFNLALRTARNSFRAAPSRAFPGRFIACDSFQGLPDVPSMHDTDNVWEAGLYRSSLDDFHKSIAGAARGIEVLVLPGWFEDTLTPANREKHGIRKIAIANVDADLYESAVLCLDFITPALQNGTVLIFDDFYHVGASMSAGEPRAIREWLVRNPQIHLTPLRQHGLLGMIFVVNLGKEDSPFYLHGGSSEGRSG
jgi:hypothetical protein